MNPRWEIEYYYTRSGDNPVYNFIQSLPQSGRAKVGRSIELLRDYGIGLKFPHVKKIQGTNLWELRIIGGDSIRILYVARVNSVFLLLHGFVKKSQKTVPKEIECAKRRLQEYAFAS